MSWLWSWSIGIAAVGAVGARLSARVVRRERCAVQEASGVIGSLADEVGRATRG